ncbi:MAG: TRAP transporter substrate-binding protein DctP [Desulfatibacillaceae bacterium]
MKFERFVLATMLAVAVALSASPAGAKTVWKTGTLVPEGVGYATYIKEILLPGLEEVTDGEITSKVYWGGIMGDDEDCLKKMHIGQLQSCGMSAQGTLLACPEMGVLTLPFMFRGYDEVDYVRDNMFDTFDEIMQSHGMKLMLWLDQGFDQIYSTKYPMSEVEQFKDARFITWYGEIEEEMLAMVGVKPIPVNVPEFNTTIRQGVADTYLGPAIWCVATQLYSTVRYVNNTDVRYSPGVMVVALDTWNDLPEEYRKRMSEKRPEWQKPFVEGSRVDNRKCLDAVFQYGVREVKMKPDELQKFKDRTRPLWNGMAGKMYSKELLEELKAELEEYRKSKGQ